MKFQALVFLLLLTFIKGSTQNKYITLNGNRVNSFDNDSTLSAADSNRLPTQRAVYKFVRNSITTPTPIGTGLFYVSRKYSGAGRASIGGLTLNSITSTNNSYNLQLTDARMGSVNLTYPDPFAARNAALDAISAGTIKTAAILVFENQQWYVGSSDPSQNGSYDGSYASGGEADVQFSQAAGNGPIASLIQNRINYDLSANAGLYYINSTFPIFTIYVADTKDSLFESHINGHGFFKQYFGQAEMGNGSNKFCLIDNAKADVSIDADLLWLQQWRCLDIYSYKSIAIKIKKAVTANTDFLILNSNTRDGDGGPSFLTVSVDDVQFSNKLYPVISAHPSDYWYFIGVGTDPDIINSVGHSSTRTKNININFGNLYLDSKLDGALFYVGNSSVAGVHAQSINLIVNIKNLYVSDNASLGLPYGLIESPYAPKGIFKNNIFTFNIDSYMGNDPLLGSFCFAPLDGSTVAQILQDNPGNQLNLNIKNAIRKTVIETGSIASSGPMFNLPEYSYTIPITVNIKVGMAKDYLGPVIGTDGAGRNQIVNNYFIEGNFAAMAGDPVLQLRSDINDYANVFLKNCSFISLSGVQTIALSTASTISASSLALSSSAPGILTVNGQAPSIIPTLSAMVH